MKAQEDNVDESTEEAIKLELWGNQKRENLKMQEELKKQEQWRELLDE